MCNWVNHVNQVASNERNCETQKTVNTIYVYGMSLCRRENPTSRVKTEPQMATVVSLWSFDLRARHFNFSVKLTFLNHIKPFTVFLTCTVNGNLLTPLTTRRKSITRPHKPPYSFVIWFQSYHKVNFSKLTHNPNLAPVFAPRERRSGNERPVEIWKYQNLGWIMCVQQTCWLVESLVNLASRGSLRNKRLHGRLRIFDCRPYNRFWLPNDRFC